MTQVLQTSYTINCFTQGRRELQAFDAQRLIAAMNADMMVHQNNDMPDGAPSGMNVAWAPLDDQYNDDDDDDEAVARRIAKRNTRIVHSNLITPRATTVPTLPLQNLAVIYQTPVVEHGTFAMICVVVYDNNSHNVFCTKIISCCCPKLFRIERQKNTTIRTQSDAFITTLIITCLRFANF